MHGHLQVEDVSIPRLERRLGTSFFAVVDQRGKKKLCSIEVKIKAGD